MEQQHWDQYAEDYHEHIVSPLRPNIQNPLFKDIARLPKHAVVADIGCGRGDLLPVLAKQCKHVFALDFSEAMIETAKQRNRALKNVTFMQQDTRDLRSLRSSFDACAVINSVIHPHFEDIELMLEQIQRSLKRGGQFFGIFPSMEAMLYHALLVYEREYRKCSNEKRALRNARRIIERGKYRFVQGVYNDDSEEQKLFLQHELELRLKRAGFSKITFDKVHYPWNDDGNGYEDFSGEPEMWDWYVRATR